MQCQEKHQQTFDRGRQVDITFYGEKHQQILIEADKLILHFMGKNIQKNWVVRS
jgi:hypothetical protein